MLVVEILLREDCAALGLIGRRLPIRIENFRGRPQIRRRIAVAIETPAHGQRRRLPHQRHGGDRAVTGGAADAFGDVDRVIEIDVIGQPLTLFQWIGLLSARLSRTGASIAVWV